MTIFFSFLHIGFELFKFLLAKKILVGNTACRIVFVVSPFVLALKFETLRLRHELEVILGKITRIKVKGLLYEFSIILFNLF